MAKVGVEAAADGRGSPDRRIWPAEAGQLAAMRTEVHRWLAPLDLPDETAHDLVLAVNEAASNAIEHAYRDGGADRGVELSLWQEPGNLYITIVDRGTWREPSTAPRGRGFGLEIMRRLVPEIAIDHDVRGTRVLLQHPLPGLRGRPNLAAAPAPDDGTQRR